MSKSRPILMSGPMVLATLGDLKTQTRRMVKGVTITKRFFHHGENQISFMCKEGIGWCSTETAFLEKCPYGVPGDELWVKETWGLSNACYGNGNNWVSVGYRAQVGNYYNPENWRDEIDVPEEVAHRYFDDFCEEACKSNGGDMPDGEGYEIFRWRPSIHMPRWASRLALRVLSVRVERLQDISEADAIAEGIRAFTKDGVIMKYAPAYRHSSGELEAAKGWAWQDMPRSAVNAYARLFDIINGDGAWASNPWVWCVEYVGCVATAIERL